ncbi:protein LONGIFOLIA 1-like isoform X1 [Zingiber officinale]|uniref:protein LONGIFOLIA 1-like isoform X1 n=1 Tax=Zingiber officinale TaxID=94328 RepID=UPI001C4AD425|nr:protein LONGIFOLIA 1-like isoform X1 [Zingiber officinale]
MLACLSGNIVEQRSCRKRNMSAKFLQAFAADHDNPELQRQIGCMTGLFQMFDRQQILTGRRLNVSSGHNHKTLPSGNALPGRNSVGSERNGCPPQVVLERNSSKRLSENQRTSMESSRTSVSSSSCSSFSSLDCNKSSQMYIDGSTKGQSDYQSLNFRDVVKDSIHKDQMHMKNHVSKQKDSASPVQLLKSMDILNSTGFDGKPKMNVDLGESLRVLAKLNQSSQYFSEANEAPRRSYEGKKSSSRFSYDGRAAHLALDSQESSKFSPKDRTPRSSNSDLKPHSGMKQVDQCTIDRRSYRTMERQQELGNCKSPPSIVAKLMGLEAMPSLSQDRQVSDDKSINKSFSTFNTHQKPSFPFEKTTTTKDDKEEHAPWRHRKNIRVPQKMRFGVRESHSKQQAESVYSEIEKRLKDLEFQQSNRDLRALKHILDAMHAKGLLENDKVEHHPSRISIHTTSPGNDQCLGSTNDQNVVFGSPIVIMKPSRSFSRSDISPSSFIPFNSLPELQGSQIRVHDDRKMDSLNTKICQDKALKSIDRQPTSQYLQSRYKKCAQEDNDTHKRCASMFQASPRPQRGIREDNRSLAKSSSALGSRLQHSQLEEEKYSSTPRPSTQSDAVPKQTANIYSSESVSPRVRLRIKPAQAQRNDDQLSDPSSGTGSLTQQVDEKSDAEVTSSNRSVELRFSSQGKRNPSGRAAKSASSTLKHKKSHISRDAAGPATVAPEKPNPITVFDPSVCHDELPPVRISSNASKVTDNTIQDLGVCCNATGKHDAPSSNLTSRLNQKKFSKVEDLVQKLRQLSPNPEEAVATDHVALLCENQNPDHRYVSEILITSGLLMLDLTSRSKSMPVQLQSSGHPINPDLFFVLEQTKAVKENINQLKVNPEKIHRKLIFNLVNELLIQKLKLASSGPLPNQLIQARCGRLPGGQNLLTELCSDIEHLKAESFTTDSHGNGYAELSEDWLYSDVELQMVVLEVERSIFRDLIDEVLGGEGAFGFQEKTSRKQRA